MQSIPDKQTGDQLGADEYTSQKNENSNIINIFGTPFDANNSFQMLQAILRVAQQAFFYEDTGTGGVYVLRKAPPLDNTPLVSYFHGLQITFKAGTTSTASSTINVDSLGTKPINGVTTTTIFAGDLVTAIYDSANDWFDLIGESTQQVIPVGTKVDYCGSADSVPTGWLPCLGQEVAQADYPALYNVLGTIWGVAVDPLNFVIPSGTFFANNIGTGDYTLNGTKLPSKTKLPTTPFTATAQSNGAHTHVIARTSHQYEETGGDSFGWSDGTGQSSSTNSAGAHTHSVTAFTGGDNLTRPDCSVVSAIIKY